MSDRKVVDIRGRGKMRQPAAEAPATGGILTSGNGGGGGGDEVLEKLEKRVEKLESDIGAIKIDVAVLRQSVDKSLVTKDEMQKGLAEIHKEIGAQTKWFIGALFVVAGLALGIARLLF